MIKYEKGDKSRFAGDGHEYHCLDVCFTKLETGLHTNMGTSTSAR